MTPLKKFVRRISGGLDLDTKLEYVGQDKLNDAINVSNINDGRKKGILNACIGVEDINNDTSLKFTSTVGLVNAKTLFIGSTVSFATSFGNCGVIVTQKNDVDTIWFVDEQSGQIVINAISQVSNFDLSPKCSYSFSQIDGIYHLIISSVSKEVILDFRLNPNENNSPTIVNSTTNTSVVNPPVVSGFIVGASSIIPSITLYTYRTVYKDGLKSKFSSFSQPIYILKDVSDKWDSNPLIDPEKINLDVYAVRSEVIPVVKIEREISESILKIQLYAVRFYKTAGFDLIDQIIEKVGEIGYDDYTTDNMYVFFDGKENRPTDEITYDSILEDNSITAPFNYAKTIHYKNNILYAANVKYESNNESVGGEVILGNLDLDIYQSNKAGVPNRKRGKHQLSCLTPKDYTSYVSPSDEEYSLYCADGRTYGAESLNLKISFYTGLMNYGKGRAKQYVINNESGLFKFDMPSELDLGGGLKIACEREYAGFFVRYNNVSIPADVSNTSLYKLADNIWAIINLLDDDEISIQLHRAGDLSLGVFADYGVHEALVYPDDGYLDMGEQGVQRAIIDLTADPEVFTKEFKCLLPTAENDDPDHDPPIPQTYDEVYLKYTLTINKYNEYASLNISYGYTEGTYPFTLLNETNIVKKNFYSHGLKILKQNSATEYHDLELKVFLDSQVPFHGNLISFTPTPEKDTYEGDIDDATQTYKHTGKLKIQSTWKVNMEWVGLTDKAISFQYQLPPYDYTTDIERLVDGKPFNIYETADGVVKYTLSRMVSKVKSDIYLNEFYIEHNKSIKTEPVFEGALMNTSHVGGDIELTNSKYILEELHDTSVTTPEREFISFIGDVTTNELILDQSYPDSSTISLYSPWDDSDPDKPTSYLFNEDPSYNFKISRERVMDNFIFRYKLDGDTDFRVTETVAHGAPGDTRDFYFKDYGDTDRNIVKVVMTYGATSDGISEMTFTGNKKFSIRLLDGYKVTNTNDDPFVFSYNNLDFKQGVIVDRAKVVIKRYGGALPGYDTDFWISISGDVTNNKITVYFYDSSASTSPEGSLSYTLNTQVDGSGYSQPPKRYFGQGANGICAWGRPLRNGASSLKSLIDRGDDLKIGTMLVDGSQGWLLICGGYCNFPSTFETSSGAPFAGTTYNHGETLSIEIDDIGSTIKDWVSYSGNNTVPFGNFDTEYMYGKVSLAVDFVDPHNEKVTTIVLDKNNSVVESKYDAIPIKEDGTGFRDFTIQYPMDWTDTQLTAANNCTYKANIMKQSTALPEVVAFQFGLDRYKATTNTISRHSFNNPAFCSKFKSLQHDSIYRLGLIAEYQESDGTMQRTNIKYLGEIRTPSMNVYGGRLFDPMAKWIDDDGISHDDIDIEMLFRPLYLKVDLHSAEGHTLNPAIKNIKIVYAKRGPADINVVSSGVISRSIPHMELAKDFYNLTQKMYQLGSVFSLPPFPQIDAGQYWWGGQIFHPGLDYDNVSYPVVDDRSNEYCFNYAQGSSYLSLNFNAPYQVAGDLSFNNEDEIRNKFYVLERSIPEFPLGLSSDAALYRASAYISSPITLGQFDGDDVWIYMSPELDYTSSEGNPIVGTLANFDASMDSGLSIHSFLSSFTEAGKYRNFLSCMSHPLNDTFSDIFELDYDYPAIGNLRKTDWLNKYNWPVVTPIETIDSMGASSLSLDPMNIDIKYLYEGILQPCNLANSKLISGDSVNKVFNIHGDTAPSNACIISCNPGFIEQIVTKFDGERYINEGIDNINNFNEVIGTIAAEDISKSYNQITTNYMPQLRHKIWTNRNNYPKILKFFISHDQYGAVDTNVPETIKGTSLHIKDYTFVNSKELFSSDLLYSYLFTCSYGDRYKLAYPTETSDATFQLYSVGMYQFVNVCPQYAAKNIPVHKYSAGEKIFNECINVSMADRCRFNYSVCNIDTMIDLDPLADIYVRHEKEVLVDNIYNIVTIPIAYAVKDSAVVAFSETFYPMDVDLFQYSYNKTNFKLHNIYEIQDTHEYNTSNAFTGLSYLPIAGDFLDPANEMRRIEKQINNQNILMNTLYKTKVSKVTTGYVYDPMDVNIHLTIDDDNNPAYKADYPIDRRTIALDYDQTIEDIESEKKLQKTYLKTIGELTELRTQYENINIDEPGVSMNFYDVSMEDMPIKSKIYPEVVWMDWKNLQSYCPEYKSPDGVVTQNLNNTSLDWMTTITKSVIATKYPKLGFINVADMYCHLGFYRNNLICGPNPYGYGGNKLIFTSNNAIPDIDRFRAEYDQPEDLYFAFDDVSDNYRITYHSSRDVHRIKNDIMYVVEAATHGPSLYMATFRSACIPYATTVPAEEEWVDTYSTIKPLGGGFVGAVTSFDTYVGVHKHNYINSFYPNFERVGAGDSGNYNSVPIVIMFPYEGLINIDSANALGDMENEANVRLKRFSMLGGNTEYKTTTGIYKQANDLYLYNPIYSAVKGNEMYSVRTEFKSSGLHPNRIHYTEYNYDKSYFNPFTVTDYIDVDPKFGEITRLFSSDDALLILQERGVASAYPNKPQLVKTEDDMSIFMGTGGKVFSSGIKYLSNTYGFNQFDNQNNVVYVENDVFWVDYLNKAIIRYSKGNVANISEMCNVTSWVKLMCNSIDKTKDNQLVVYSNRDITVRFKFNSAGTGLGYSPFADDIARNCIEFDPTTKKFTSFITSPYNHSCKIGNYNLFISDDNKIYKEGKYDAKFYPDDYDIEPSIYTFVVPDERPEIDKEFYDVFIDNRGPVERDIIIDLRDSGSDLSYTERVLQCVRYKKTTPAIEDQGPDMASNFVMTGELYSGIYTYEGTGTANVDTSVLNPRFHYGEDKLPIKRLARASQWGSYIQMPIEKYDSKESNMQEGSMIFSKGIHIRLRFQTFNAMSKDELGRLKSVNAYDPGINREDYYFDPIAYSYLYLARFNKV